MAIFLPIKERELLGKRLPREKTKCPECGELAERERNGKWRCLGQKKIQDFPPLYLQTCGAQGVTFKDGDWATTRGSLHAA